jgi:cytochrome c biogenesis protein CcmG/thiol:disulfide interchange protein DsbE
MTELTNVEPKKSAHLPLWVIVLAFVVLLAFLVLLGLGLSRSQQGTMTVGSEVKPFSLSTFDGKTIQTEDLKGKVIVLNFWASWCTTCETEAADLEDAWQGYKESGDVIFLGVDYADTEPEALAYLEEFTITYDNGPDLGTKISQMFRVRAVPETYIIGRDGKLAYKQIGPFSSVAEIQGIIDRLLQ